MDIIIFKNTKFNALAEVLGMIWEDLLTKFLLFFTHDQFIELKAEKTQKHSFWLQKGVKNSIRCNVLIHNHEIVGSFICYFWFMAILSSQSWKTKNTVFGYKK